jgi:hypothetical protein
VVVSDNKLGSGLLGRAQQSMSTRPYQVHVKEAQALGQTPMTQQEFEENEKKTMVQGVLTKLRGK